MDYRILGKTGLKLSVIGFGAGPLGGEYGTVDPSEGKRTVHAAIDRGINLFDTAPYYGRTLSETRLGEALLGKRQSIILCSKLGRYDKASFDFSAARVATSIDESLRRLQTDYLDLLIAHDVEFADREFIIAETLPAMRKLQAAGKARFIGISGLPLKILADIGERGRVDFVLSYCRYALLNRDLDRWLTPVADKHNFGLIGAAAVHMGILTDQGPQPWHPAQEKIKEAGKKIVAICHRHGIDAATLAVWFTTRHPKLASTLVGMARMSELEANLKALTLQPSPELLAEVDAVAAPVYNTIWPSGLPENDD
ncbi:MAG TPA: aldo/keto reductase [Bryobacteraceae bacterium]|jgi:L-galactose dehydrogenase|nr:aldo/keto reductase [Bryobacteraceae bacterium]